ncbi:MAG: hypothetical protein QXD70_01015, partial [Candidatus Bathyarchaeia archaeon]
MEDPNLRYNNYFIDFLTVNSNAFAYVKKQYPVKMNAYNQRVGKLLTHRICQIFKKLGYKTWMNPLQGNGVDIKVWRNGYLLLV